MPLWYSQPAIISTALVWSFPLCRSRVEREDADGTRSRDRHSAGNDPRKDTAETGSSSVCGPGPRPPGYLPAVVVVLLPGRLGLAGLGSAGSLARPGQVEKAAEPHLP